VTDGNAFPDFVWSIGEEVNGSAASSTTARPFSRAIRNPGHLDIHPIWVMNVGEVGLFDNDRNARPVAARFAELAI